MYLTQIISTGKSSLPISCRTFGVGCIILDLDIVDADTVGLIICRTYYVCRLDLNL